MAHDVLIAGALFPDVPSVQFPDSQQQWHSFVDVSDTTAAAADVAQGKVFYDASGALTQGTASGGGGSSSYTLLGSHEVTVNTTNTSVKFVTSYAYTASTVYTSQKIIYVKIRDKAGKREDRFYGADCFFLNEYPALSKTTAPGPIFAAYRVTANGVESRRGSGDAYGVFASGIADNGTITIKSRYSSSYSLTVNATYTVEVYSLDWPNNVSPFTL